jgi:large subunit ribosomal protein L30
MAKKTTTQKTSATRRLKITLLKSTIGFNRSQAETVRGMGLRRIRHTVELPDTPETRGMIHKVRHLVAVER